VGDALGKGNQRTGEQTQLAEKASAHLDSSVNFPR
jgi:hypothetical protein